MAVRPPVSLIADYFLFRFNILYSCCVNNAAEPPCGPSPELRNDCKLFVSLLMKTHESGEALNLKIVSAQLPVTNR